MKMTFARVPLTKKVPMHDDINALPADDCPCFACELLRDEDQPVTTLPQNDEETEP